MRVVVADATPLHYLILIDAAFVLPRLFEKIHVPLEVRDELICEANEERFLAALGMTRGE